jgi:hypothetical protein
MSNPLDTEAGSELFSSYEAELKLVQADLNQKLDQIPDLSGEPRKATISQADRALEEASELVGIMPLTLDDDTDSAFSSIKCALRSRTFHLQHVPKSTNASATTNPTSTPQSGNFALWPMTALPCSAADTRITRTMYSSSNDSNCYLEQIGWIAAHRG